MNKEYGNNVTMRPGRLQKIPAALLQSLVAMQDKLSMLFVSFIPNSPTDQMEPIGNVPGKMEIFEKLSWKDKICYSEGLLSILG